ncbi:hypothetical protein WICMUC_003966 [Wickerhamomyces mucosus]|uniref:Uncharacterized protein n=1 Tax=Wickerhamomyces mucosus TaxID=1378264 RepID=A0A9P8PIU3_9ASCO|nr:hypothetical protein WICMUC_003966 [Wickerhamomyces mucosus]
MSSSQSSIPSTPSTPSKPYSIPAEYFPSLKTHINKESPSTTYRYNYEYNYPQTNGNQAKNGEVLQKWNKPDILVNDNKDERYSVYLTNEDYEDFSPNGKDTKVMFNKLSIKGHKKNNSITNFLKKNLHKRTKSTI